MTRIDFKGHLEEKREIRVGFVGCGSHSLRNLFPVFQFAPVKLIATCDVVLEKAKAYCEKFGGERYFDNLGQMLQEADLDAVMVCVGNNKQGKPVYVDIAVECMEAGCHVWIEKPPAATTADIERMMLAEKKTGKKVMVGYKKMFVQANMKAKELAYSADFGGISMVMLQNPEVIPSQSDLNEFLLDEKDNYTARKFMEHLCHPVSQMISLLGYPVSMFYERNSLGAGVMIFHFPSDVIATIHMTCGCSMNGGVERTTIISRQGIASTGRIGGRHIVVDNNLTLSYHRNPDFSYGDETSFYKGTPDENTAVWQPEFSRGQMFNKGLFLLGYYNEIQEFADALLEDREFKDGTLTQAWAATRIFEKMVEGSGKNIVLEMPPKVEKSENGGEIKRDC